MCLAASTPEMVPCNNTMAKLDCKSELCVQSFAECLLHSEIELHAMLLLCESATFVARDGAERTPQTSVSLDVRMSMILIG